MKNTYLCAALALLALAALAASPGAAAAPDTSVAVKPQKAKPQKTAKPTFIPGSQETVAQRSARLKRECKGGVNAGACAGYTR